MKAAARASGVAALATAGGVLLVAPFAALVWRTPWIDLPSLLASPVTTTALRLSLTTSLLATLVCVVVGIPLAWLLARRAFPGRTVLRAMTVLPMVLPPVVGGVALLLAFGRRGILGQWLYDWFGWQLPFTTAGAVVAEAFVALPFLVVTAESAFRTADVGLEDAARTMGARPFTVFWRVTLPLCRPALVAGAALAWARALGEFGATITFAGNAPGETQTLPLQVYVLLESGDADGAIAVSVVLVAVSIAVLVLLRDRWLATR